MPVESKGESQRIESVARALLRPVLRLLFARGLPRRALEQVCDEAYVGAAAQQLRRVDDNVDLARVAELSGLPVSRVKRLKAIVDAETRSDVPPVTEQAPLMIAATRVMTGWHADVAFTDADGRPLPCRPDEPLFRRLVRRYGGGFTGNAIGGLLLSTESVRLNEHGEFVPQGRHILAAPHSEELEYSALEAFVDLARAVEANQRKLLASTGVVQRTCANDRMPKRVAPRVNRMIREHTQAFLESIDDWLVQHESRDEPATGGEPLVRLGVGVYVIADD